MASSAVSQGLRMVLESYVLRCLGHLSKEQALAAQHLTITIFGPTDDWATTVCDKLQIPAGMDKDIIALWAENTKAAQKAKTELDPVEFSILLVQENFSSLLGG